jgi:uncharacterized membrane protein HdeD (DUF308 family)
VTWVDLCLNFICLNPVSRPGPVSFLDGGHELQLGTDVQSTLRRRFSRLTQAGGLRTDLRYTHERREYLALTGTTVFWQGVVRPTLTEGTLFMFKSLKSSSTSLILLGVLAVIVGIIAIAWPGVTILALVILFAVYAFMDAGLQAARAFSSRSAGPVFGHLLLALISLAAGVVALVWPGPTAYVLVIVVGAWALVGGVVEVIAGFGLAETAGTRALFILSGLVSVAFGVLLFARPGVGAVTLALLFGLYSMIYGFSQIAAGVHVRQLSNDFQPLSELRNAA